MRHRPQLLRCMSLLVGTLVMLSGCTYVATGGLLSPVDQEELAPERHMMTAPPATTSLGKAAAATRAALLGESGLTQRVQALDSQEQEAVHSGVLHSGMSADALRLTWGEPSYTTGRTNHAEHWYYLGAAPDLATAGHQLEATGTQVDVYLVNGHVVAWADFVPTGTAEGSGKYMQR